MIDIARPLAAAASLAFKPDGTSPFCTGDATCAHTFDPAKPVQTRDGRKARILATDLAGRYPIAAAIAARRGTYALPTELVERYHADGKMGACGPTSADLVNVPVETVEYRNVYPGGMAGSADDYVSVPYDTAGSAKAARSRLAPEVFTIEITRTDGRVSSVELCPDA